jgi:hypothetical protein
MSEERFWKSTPRKIQALMHVHVEANNPQQKPKPKMTFIDHIL